MTDLAADATGAYLAGFFSSSFDFARSTVEASGPLSSFVLHVAPDGTSWGQRLGGSSGDIAYALAIDQSGLVFVGGEYSSSDFSFAGVTLPSPPPASAAFVAALSAGSGQPQWIRSFSPTGVAAKSSIGALAADSSRLVLLGSFNGELALPDGAVLRSIPPRADVFVAAVGSLGDFEAAYKFGSDDFAVPGGLALSRAGTEVVVALGFSGVLVLDRLDQLIVAPTRRAAGFNDAYVAVLSQERGTYRRVWDRGFGSADAEYAQHVATSQDRMAVIIRRAMDGVTAFDAYAPSGRAFLLALGL